MWQRDNVGARERGDGRARARAGTSLQSKIQNPKSKTAFTLVELLVVITIIGLLIAVLVLAGGHVLYAQKVNLTKMIMKNVAVALDQFAAEDPLRGRYDNKHLGETFGPYPPYMLATPNATSPQPNKVAGIVEPNCPFSANYDLQHRLAWDLGNSVAGDPSPWAHARAGSADPNEGNDDIRALYIYLKLYSPGGLSQVPQTAIKPIPAPGKVDMVYPKGGADPNSAVDVFGIYDAWGVPLDYFLYVKLEWGPPRSTGSPGDWYVVDRKPVLRSRGITLDEYKAEAGGTDELDPPKWIFSEDFPLPPANHSSTSFKKDGLMPAALGGSVSQQNGWARAPGSGDLDQNSFGYVP